MDGVRLIILSAFNGRLRSEPIEWTGGNVLVRMPLAKKPGCQHYELGKDALLSGDLPAMQIGEFTYTSRCEVIRDGVTADIYELTNITAPSASGQNSSG